MQWQWPTNVTCMIAIHLSFFIWPSTSGDMNIDSYWASQAFYDYIINFHLMHRPFKYSWNNNSKLPNHGSIWKSMPCYRSNEGYRQRNSPAVGGSWRHGLYNGYVFVHFLIINHNAVINISNTVYHHMHNVVYWTRYYMWR